MTSRTSYRRALRKLTRLMELTRPTRAQTAELHLLSYEIARYEERNFRREPPNALAALRFRMDQMRMTPRDLSPALGSPRNVRRILAGTQPLTLTQARILHHRYGIPAVSLLEPLET